MLYFATHWGEGPEKGLKGNWKFGRQGRNRSRARSSRAPAVAAQGGGVWAQRVADQRNCGRRRSAAELGCVELYLLGEVQGKQLQPSDSPLKCSMTKGGTRYVCLSELVGFSSRLLQEQIGGHVPEHQVTAGWAEVGELAVGAGQAGGIMHDAIRIGTMTQHKGVAQFVDSFLFQPTD